MSEIQAIESRLMAVFNSIRPSAVALSGGVDSMTLAFMAHRALGSDVSMFHAMSAAVPASATKRVKDYAQRLGWQLHLIDAGEFADERYLANPSNRCYFCKSNLYGTLSSLTQVQLLSGTNMDDLGDWRPGLQAAENHHVRHPFVEAKMSKADIRLIAAHYGLTDIAELPSAPCLSSRVETRIRIEPDILRSIDKVETMVREQLNPQTIRCRIRHNNVVVVELDEKTLELMDSARRSRLCSDISAIFTRVITVNFAPYVRGSAFIREKKHD